MDKRKEEYACQQCNKQTERLYFCTAPCKALFFNKEQEEALFPPLLGDREPVTTMMSPTSGRVGSKKVNK